MASHFVKMFFLGLVLLCPALGFAETGVVLTYAGFMGQVAAGVSYRTNQRHSIEGTFGTYNNQGTHLQMNLGYDYSAILYERSKLLWKPLKLGVRLLTPIGDSDYFYQSPSKYPGEDYYDETALRLGVKFGAGLELPIPKIEFDYFVMLLDDGVVALFRNKDANLVRYYFSSGLAIKYWF